MKRDEILAEALKALRAGGTILYPTDTVWGLGCDATNEKAVARIYDIKRRADSKALVLLACDLDMVAKYIKEIPSIAIDLVEVNDAPMTIIYPGAQYLAPNAVAEDGSVGIRIPLDSSFAGSTPSSFAGSTGESPVSKPAAPRNDLTAGAFCRELVRRLRRPLVSTSANISGEPTPASFAEIPEEIKVAVDYVVPKPFGAGATGRSSQIIKLGLDGEVQILRP